MRLLPLLTGHPKGGTRRPLTPGLLADSYVAPSLARLTGRPRQGRRSNALRRVRRATPDLCPGIEVSRPAPSPSGKAPTRERHSDPTLRQHDPFLLAPIGKLKHKRLRIGSSRAAFCPLLVAKGTQNLATAICAQGAGHGITMGNSAGCILRRGGRRGLIAEQKSLDCDARRTKRPAGRDL